MQNPSQRASIWTRTITILSNICGVLSATMILASVFITCQMIFIRSVLNQSTIWQTEAVIYLMIAATLVGLPYVQHQRGHVGVDLIPGMLRPGARRVLAIIVLALTLAMAMAMAFYGWEMFHLAWSRNWKSETVWAVPLWIPYLSVPLGFAIFALQLSSDLWLAIKGDNVQLSASAHGVSPDGENL